MRALLLCLLILLVAAPAAPAGTFLPPKGKVFHGVASGADISDFERRVGRHPDVWQHWIQWGSTFRYALERSAGADTRVMLHLSTAAGQHQPGRISPGAIARGDGDAYLVQLNRTLAAHDAPVYLRLMAEMNNCDLAYSSHDCSGRRRGGDHSAGRFKQAWRRTVIVVRGGDVDAIDARLRRVGLPALDTDEDELERPRVAFVWSPMTGGSPMISALRPGRFWPGARYVDWVGTSFYSRFPNFHFLEPYYRDFAVRFRKPFVFSEWAMWGADAPAFARRLFAWTKSHDRVRMMVYNQGQNPAGPFRLKRFPRAESVIRRELRSPRFG